MTDTPEVAAIKDKMNEENQRFAQTIRILVDDAARGKIALTGSKTLEEAVIKATAQHRKNISAIFNDAPR